MASIVNNSLLPSEDLYEIIPVPGKGRGMCAIKDIEKGTRIVEDEILMSIPEGLSKQGKFEAIISAYNGLPLKKKQSFLNLYDPVPIPMQFDITSKFTANAFEISTLWGVSQHVSVQTAFINHSCLPNAYLDVNTNINRITVHATVNILAGEEITVSYCLPYFSREIRHRDLAHHDFICSCRVCLRDQTSELEEAQRSLMQQIWLTLYTNDGEESSGPGGALAEVFHMIRLLSKEELNVGALSRLYERAARLHLEMGEKAMALGLAETKLELEMCRLGPDSPTTQATMRYISDMRAN